MVAVVPPLLQVYAGLPALLTVTVAEPLLALHEVGLEEVFNTNPFEAATVTMAIEAQLL